MKLPGWDELLRLAFMSIIGWGLMLATIYFGAKIVGAL